MLQDPPGPEDAHLERETPACAETPSDLASLERSLEPIPAASTIAALTAAKAADQEKAKEKKKKKARAAWISFAGRIVAQIVGAVATIVLGVYAVNRYTEPRVGGEEKPAVSGSQSAAVRPPSPANGNATIVVLPLSNFSGDAAQEPFADGLTEALIAELAQVPDLRVISRTSAMYYKGRQKTMPKIAQELGADLVVEGSVTSAGDRLRVTAQLIDGPRDEHLWARSYDHRVRDALALQAQVAAAIAKDVMRVVSATRTEQGIGASVPDSPANNR